VINDVDALIFVQIFERTTGAKLILILVESYYSIATTFLETYPQLAQLTCRRTLDMTLLSPEYLSTSLSLSLPQIRFSFSLF
jgi:hypothetical protein